MHSVVVSVPGKVMISGEYAVLDGATAIVAATSARARVTLWATGGSDSPSSLGRSPDLWSAGPEVVLARKLAESRFGASAMHLSIDAHELRSEPGRGGAKLGLGSSAAVTVGVLAACAASADHSIESLEVRRSLLPLALEAHRAVAPRGSGADVAASAFGGFIEVQRTGHGDLEVEPIAWPETLETYLLWSGTPSRTSDLLDAAERSRLSAPREHGRAMATLGDAANAFAVALRRGVHTEVLDRFDRCGRAMASLGEVIGAPIVTPAFDHAAHAVRSLGGAAKPSGAGGGDVALALFAQPIEIETLERATGLRVLPITLGARGPRRESLLVS